MTDLTKRSDAQWADDADAWYFDLSKLGTYVVDNHRAQKRANVRILTIAVVGLLSVLVLAYVTQQQSAEIRRQAALNARNVFAQCQVDTRNAVALNKTLDQIQQGVRRSKSYTAAQKPAIIAVYESAKASFPVCGTEPR